MSDDSQPKRRSGFTMMTPEQRRAMASLAGKKAQALGKAHRYNTGEARIAGKKGGLSLAQDKAHMRRIGQLGGQASAKKRPTPPEPKVDESLTFNRQPEMDVTAANYAQRAVSTAKDGANVDLDYSEASIAEVERLLTMARRSGMTKQDERKLDLFVHMFGFYVGEVFRRHHGGEWGTVNAIPLDAIQDANGNVYTPLTAVRKHLVAQLNIGRYFRRMTRGVASSVLVK